MKPGTRHGAARRHAVLVVGMHRSGTSALTRVLNLLGVELGSRLMPARPGVNDKGFFENERVQELHEEILATLGAAWDDVVPLPPSWWADERLEPARARLATTLREEFGEAPLFGVKDPRLCVLYRLWPELLAAMDVEPCPVLVLRSPDEVARSLATIHGFAPEKSHALWLRHVVESERATRDAARVLVTFDQLLADWRGVVDRIADAFALRWPLPAESAAPAVEEFLDPALRRSRVDRDEALDQSEAAIQARRAWRVLETAAAGSSVDLAAVLDEAVAPLDALLVPVRPLVVGELRQTRGELSRARSSLRQTKERYRESQSQVSQTKELAASRAQQLEALGERLETRERELSHLREARESLQSIVAALRDALARRRRLLRKLRRSAVWKLLSLWRSLRRRVRRIRRANSEAES